MLVGRWPTLRHRLKLGYMLHDQLRAHKNDMWRLHGYHYIVYILSATTNNECITFLFQIEITKIVPIDHVTY